MIVVAIIAILASIAYPSYTQYVVKGKRSEGRAMLTDSAARLERFYSDNNRYATADNIIPTAAGISTSSENGYYTIAITGTYQTYVLTATPVTPFVDSACGTLSLAQDGTRTSGSGSGIYLLEMNDACPFQDYCYFYCSFTRKFMQRIIRLRSII